MREPTYTGIKADEQTRGGKVFNRIDFTSDRPFVSFEKGFNAKMRH
jgi:hypothetical protein